MSKRKQNGDVMDGADRDISDTATVERKKPQPRQVIDPVTHEWRDETKGEKFVRLGKQRTLNAVKRIRQLIPLGKQAQYPHTDEQAEKIIDKLQQAVNDVKAAFRGQAANSDNFDL